MKRVMFLGADSQHASTISQAQKSGFEVVAIEKDPSAAARFEADEFFPVDINDQQTALEIAHISGVDGVLALNPAGIAAAAYISNEMGLVGLTPEAAFACRDIAGKRTAWEEKDLPYLACADIEDWHGKMSRGQNFIIESLVQDGDIRFNSFSHVELKRIKDHYINGSQFYPAQFDEVLSNKLYDLTNKSMAALGIKNAVIYTQIQVVDDAIYLINQYPCAPVGPIMSTVMTYAYGIDFVRAVCSVLTGESVELKPQHSNPCVIYYIDLEPGTLKSLSNIDEAKSIDGVLEIEIDVMPGEDIIIPSRKSHRAGYVIINGETAEQTNAVYQQVINTIQYEMQD